MTFNWYKIFNKIEFEAEGLVSREIELILEAIGSKTFLVTKGNDISISIDGVMLSLNAVAGVNPFVFEGKAVYLSPSSDVYYGIQVT